MIERIKNKAVFGVVNTEVHRELLEEIPHRHFLDLSVFYYTLDGADKEDSGIRIITNDMMGMTGISEHQLFLWAEQNTYRILPPTVLPIEMLLNDLSDGKIAMPDVPCGDVWVITNSSYFLGAASILYSNFQQNFAERILDDLYILPSSVHEIIAVPASHYQPDELKRIVEQANMSCVAPEERLSGEVYYYDRTLKRLEIASKKYKDSGNTEGSVYGN